MGPYPPFTNEAGTGHCLGRRDTYVANALYGLGHEKVGQRLLLAILLSFHDY
jgi:hypothetical protein